MSRRTAGIIGLLVALLLIIMTAPVPSFADKAYWQPACTSVGVVNAYGVYGEEMDVSVPATLTFQQSYCEKGTGSKFGKMRIMRSTANTLEETKYQRSFAKHYADEDNPIAFCKTDGGGSKFFALAQNFGTNNINTVRPNEMDNWRPFLRQFTERRVGCVIYG